MSKLITDGGRMTDKADQSNLSPVRHALSLVRGQHWGGDDRFCLRCTCGWEGRQCLTEKTARNTAKDHKGVSS